MQCGLSLEGQSAGTCGRCLQKTPPWDRVLAALLYGFPVDVLVRRFKFNRNMACGEVLGIELGRKVVEAVPGYTRPDLIVPVPLHRSRQASRTFNQSELLARHVGRRLEIPVDHRLLSRVRKTRAQSGLDARSRRRNTRGAFHCRYRRSAGIRHAALVDDVMTTGSTLEACTRELHRAGIGEVSVWVVARAPPP
jgi:ComF family protein